MEGVQLLLPVAQGSNPCIALVTAGMAVLATACWLVIRLVFVKGNTDRRPCEADGMRMVPGSRGLPIIGETLEFLALSPSLQIPAFFQRHLIVSLDPEVTNFVFQQEERLFQMWYPDSFIRIIGTDSLIRTHGLLHRHIKNLALRLFGPENLRREIIHDVQKTVEASLSSWLNQPSIELKEAVSSMIFKVTAKKLISYDSSTSDGKMWKQYDAFTQGLFAFPLCIPGTAFYKCMQGRKNVIKMLKEILDERKNTEEHHESVDFFDVIEEVKAENPDQMTENAALDLLFLLLFASFETTSSGVTAMLIFLTDNPEALQELIEEHNNIRKRKADKNSEITWEEYKSMKFTSHVIHEALRLASIAPVMFREAIEDVHIKVLICCMHVAIYVRNIPEPASGASKDFMAFGGGLRLCVGAHFAKLQMAVFLHCLVTKSSWKAIKGGRMALSPGLRFPEGFHIQLFPKA
uniref:Cytochrome P450 n=1 Tax=Oryza barthii TaxID=65489 RepID=A0A0D3HBP2_9ORYZ